jgi:hypothetical protein
MPSSRVIAVGIALATLVVVVLVLLLQQTHHGPSPV